MFPETVNGCVDSSEPIILTPNIHLNDSFPSSNKLSYRPADLFIVVVTMYPRTYRLVSYPGIQFSIVLFPCTNKVIVAKSDDF